ncbi:MAG TPA: (d)CMP kinase [Synergistales bacterium]|nr:(d)CMP kinase [Synergistaceae bacterium]HPE64671.1 (d)CMP kinase [Synergistales bacterium]
MNCVSFVAAIDGPAGAGKSTLARKVANLLRMRYLDTGALYRALAFSLYSSQVSPEEGPEMEAAIAGISVEILENGLLLNGKEVGKEIRSPLVDSIVSSYAALPSVRKRLLSIQREQGKHGSLVADGRDMGTVVFPDADVKIFLTASDEVRAKRRLLELRERGEDVTYEEVLQTIRERDRVDSERSTAPLRKAEGAIEVNTDALSIEEAVAALASIISKRKGA